MKCGTMMRSTTLKYGKRLDAEFYLGDETAIKEDMERAEKRLQLSRIKLRECKRRLKSDRRRAKSMECGEIKVIK